jgi:hypothetical protein
MESVKRKLKDWEDRFYVKYNRPATREDIKKFPRVEQVYQQLKQYKKEKDEILQPSPFKKKSGGLLKTLSASNVTTKSISFTDRLLAVGNDEKENKMNKLEVIPEKSKKHKVDIEVDNNQGVADSLVIKRFLESGKRSWTMPKPKLEKKSSLFSIKKTSFSKSSPSQTDIPMDITVQSPVQIAEKIGLETIPVLKESEYSVPVVNHEESAYEYKPIRPNKNIASRTWKRHSSFTVTELPSNYKDFLSKEEESKLLHVIGTVNIESQEPRVDGKDPQRGDAVESPRLEEKAQKSPEPKVFKEEIVVPKTRSKRKSNTAELDKKSKVKVDNANYRSMDLKSKSKGKQKQPFQKGKNFKKQRYLLLELVNCNPTTMKDRKKIPF